jgi:hypothetical protein
MSDETTTSSMKGARHVNRDARNNPLGTPAMAEMEKAVMTTPVAAPRRCGGIASPMIACSAAPATPPKASAKARAASNDP